MALSDNLVAYYSLGSITADAGGLNLTNNNTATFVTGKVGDAANFASASSQYLSRADDPTFDMGDIDFTICCWVYLATKPAAVMAFLSKQVGSGNQRSYNIVWNNSVDRFRCLVSPLGTAGSNIVTTANNFGAPATTTWYFLAMRHDAAANTLTLSVNDGTPDSQSVTGGAFVSTAPFEIGRLDSGNYLNGRVDEVGIWKRKLSDAEITELYNSGNGRDYAYIAGAGSQTISPNVIASTETVYQPTLTFDAITVAPNAIASTSVIYQPAIQPQAITISPNVIASTEQVFAPTVTPGAIAISPNLIASGVQVFAPTITTGAITVALDTIASTAVIYQPTITVSDGTITITPELIASSAQVFAPTLTFGSITIAPDTIVSTAVVFEPDVMSGALVITPNLIASSAQVFEPALTFGAISVALDTVASAAVIYEPTLTPGAITIAPNLLASGVIVYQPTVLQAAIQTIELERIESTAIVYQVIVALYTASIERMYSVPAEQRGLRVPTESRQFVIAAESRVYTP